MSNHTKTAATGHPAMDYPEHERTYDRFISMSKWGTVIVIAILVFMAWFLL